MAKRGLTKAQQILNAASEQVDKARNALTEARVNWQTAEAVYHAHEQAYFALERVIRDGKKKRNPPKTRIAEPGPLPENDSERQVKAPI